MSDNLEKKLMLIETCFKDFSAFIELNDFRDFYYLLLIVKHQQIYWPN